jgi:hypothetical protein
MKLIWGIIAVSFLISACAFAEDDFRTGSEPDGWQVKWGTQISYFSGLVFDKQDAGKENLKYYTRSNDGLDLFTCRAKKINYIFDSGQYSGVEMTFTADGKYTTWVKLYKRLSSVYGEGKEDLKLSTEVRTWVGDFSYIRAEDKDDEIILLIGDKGWIPAQDHH